MTTHRSLALAGAVREAGAEAREYIAQVFEDIARAGGTHIDDDPGTSTGLELSPDHCRAVARRIRSLELGAPAEQGETLSEHVLYWSTVGDLDDDSRGVIDAHEAPADHGWLVAHTHEDTLRALLRGETLTMRMQHASECAGGEESDRG